MIDKQTVVPTALAVSLVNAKAQLNVEQSFTADDALIIDLIHAATWHIERIIQRPIMEQTWLLLLADFAKVIELARTPVISITDVKYFDVSDAEQIIDPSNYQKDIFSTPGKIIFNDDFNFPETRKRFDAVRINYVAGYVDEAAVPHDLKQWIKILLSRFYERREYFIDPKMDLVIKSNLMANAAWI